jgi:hypothetical protein
MMKLLVALGATAGLAFSASAAYALPGDAAVDSSSPFRLNERTLEPGCFTPGRFSEVDLDQHIDLTYLAGRELASELHVTLDEDAPFSVDQVLVPSRFGGYAVYSAFDTGTINNDDDIDPGQTAVDMFAPDSNDIDGPDPIDRGDIVVCVSDHGALQNEPYASEDGGLVSAKNRPVVVPAISALGVSAISNLNTYKVGFGYSVERWYTAPTYDGAGAFPFMPLITDPNAAPTNIFTGLPLFVRMNPREDGDYDARRVNDMDTFADEFSGDQADLGQVRMFSAAGDSTAWTLSNNNDADTLGHLITFTAQGDLPLTWTLRPSLGAPSTERSVTIDQAYLDAWNQAWQNWCAFRGPKPALPLAPGTSAPCQRGAEPAPAPAAPAAPPATSTTTVIERTTVVTAPASTKATTKAGAKKGATKAQKARYAKCVRTANRKHSAKARHKARATCSRMKH